MGKCTGSVSVGGIGYPNLSGLKIQVCWKLYLVDDRVTTEKVAVHYFLADYN